MGSLITYVHGTLFLTSLLTKTSSDQFEVYPLAKMIFYFDIFAWSLTLNLGYLSWMSVIQSIYVLYLTSVGFILIVL